MKKVKQPTYKPLPYATNPPGSVSPIVSGEKYKPLDQLAFALSNKKPGV